jgi:UDP-N-acetylglucosamine acyltransferase
MSLIHPTAIVASSATLAEDVEIGPYCIIGEQVTIGARTQLKSHVVIDGITEIGEDCVIHPFAHLGGPPQHTAHKGELTRLTIGDRNLIREQTTMHCGTVAGRGVTTVGSDCIFYVGAHIAHDCIVGDNITLINHATLGGHVVVQDFAILGGLAAVHQFIRIGRYAFIGGCAAVTKDIIPYGSAWGNHAHLEGLNLVGLKRRGFGRDEIKELRAAYRMLFADEGTLQERVEDVSRVFAGSEEVGEIIEFIQADSNRPLCLPHVDD